ncbi:39S ribosomal protein L2, mitochondrial [Patella vulgata]|uniref:39S ribosomal protein L2, mitochondrial n=1 Tax=Patella vulgata TaxID=6465 RepID=UPI0021806C4B|nr:39S ribosomal protein L2, mitochondrial [Patella vulgata]XP_050414153.1 39S ribosomal protein L2, mitochondrial [Patella vulgata]XP_050414155.1 39S ribosomal protein L2, mitochondrial [Patella vulgata]
MAAASLSQLMKSLARLSLLNHAKSRQSFHTSSIVDGKAKFIKLGINVDRYTLRPIHLPKSGGRGHDGRIQTHGVGGGHRQCYRMVDFKRIGPKTGEPLVERVLAVRYDPCRSADIAVVAGGEKARYIVASENMKAGDLIKSSGELKKITVKAIEGDSYPLGSLPLGTLVHNIEIYPETGGRVARAAGTCGQLIKKIGDRCIIRMPSKREMNVSEECTATVGRVSNIDHNKQHIGSASRARWFGIRPDSGWKQKKTGYNGRKIKPVKPVVIHKASKAPASAIYKDTV